MQLGPCLKREDNIDKKVSFEDFAFPACNKCNQFFSDIENKIKLVMGKVLTNEAIHEYEADLLLDWFDKVRVGLWLGYHQILDHTYWNIKPNYYILDRVGISDRALIVYRINDNKQRLIFTGINTPSFAHSPTCFALYINNCVFINISTDFLISKRAGLPYPNKILLRSDGSFMLKPPLFEGKKRIDLPILGLPFEKNCSVIAQPIIIKYIPIMEANYSNSEYVELLRLDDGKMRPIVQIGNNSPLLMSIDPIKVLCDQKYSIKELLFMVVREVLVIQRII
jgi:hypothetical protein